MSMYSQVHHEGISHVTNFCPKFGIHDYVHNSHIIIYNEMAIQETVSDLDLVRVIKKLTHSSQNNQHQQIFNCLMYKESTYAIYQYSWQQTDTCLLWLTVNKLNNYMLKEIYENTPDIYILLALWMKWIL